MEDIASAAGVTRGLVHHYFGGRKDVYIGLLEQLGAQLEQQLRPPLGRSARARVADTVSRWLDWSEVNRTVWLATIAHGEDIADPDVRRVVTDLVRRAVALLAEFHADIAEDSPRVEASSAHAGTHLPEIKTVDFHASERHRQRLTAISHNRFRLLGALRRPVRGVALCARSARRM